MWRRIFRGTQFLELLIFKKKVLSFFRVRIFDGIYFEKMFLAFFLRLKLHFSCKISFRFFRNASVRIEAVMLNWLFLRLIIIVHSKYTHKQSRKTPSKENLQKWIVGHVAKIWCCIWRNIPFWMDRIMSLLRSYIKWFVQWSIDTLLLRSKYWW